MYAQAAIKPNTLRQARRIVDTMGRRVPLPHVKNGKDSADRFDLRSLCFPVPACRPVT